LKPEDTMPDPELIHKSRKYADKIMEEPTEDCIREMLFSVLAGSLRSRHRERLGYPSSSRGHGTMKEDH